MHIVVRKHPRHAKKTDKQILKFVANNRKISWDKSATFLDALKGVRAVATVNSTAGLEAINAGYPVLCYGRAVYRREDVAICLENSKDDSKAAIKAIKHGDVSLNRANLQSFVKLVKSKQIHRKKTANVIISMLQGLR
jgi:capsule polysaccharide modification protein KpsS